MYVKLFNLRHSASAGGFDDLALAQFVSDKHVESLSEHVYTVDGVPHLVCIVRWNALERPSAARVPDRDDASAMPTSSSPASPAAERRRDRTDPSAALEPESKALFETLRAWRATRARAEGVPAYRVFTNAELCKLALRRPREASELEAIPRIGAVRAALYGAEVLPLLLGSRAVALASSVASAPAAST